MGYCMGAHVGMLTIRYKRKPVPKTYPGVVTVEQSRTESTRVEQETNKRSDYRARQATTGGAGNMCLAKHGLGQRD